MPRKVPQSECQHGNLSRRASPLSPYAGYEAPRRRSANVRRAAIGLGVAAGVFACRDLPEAWMPRGEHYKDVLAAMSRQANTPAATGRCRVAKTIAARRTPR